MLSPLVPRPSSPPVDLTIRDFKADRALGRASLFGEIANAAATQICSLYGKSPSTLVRTVPFGAGAIDNSRGVFDDLCEDIAPLPPAPTPNFTGGQCDRVRYRVRGVAKLKQKSSPTQNFPERDVPIDVPVWGLITHVLLEDFVNDTTAPFTGSGYSRLTCYCRGLGGTALSTVGPHILLGSSDNEIQSIGVITITKFDGSPDTCGNPAPVYPPPSASPGDLDKTTIINVSPNVSVSVPVKIVPTFAPSANIFKPEFNVDVGGINVNISAGGFTFSPTVEIPVDLPYPYSDPRAVKPPSIAIKIDGGGGGGECDLTEVIDRLIDIEDEVVRCCDRDAPHSPPQANKVLSQEYLMAGSIFQSLPARTFQVTVDVLTRPESEKFQAGGVSAPTVLYAGWFWFAAGNHMSDRMPVDAEFKIFSPPERVTDSFACSMKGYTARIVAYYINPDAD